VGVVCVVIVLAGCVGISQDGISDTSNEGQVPNISDKKQITVYDNSQTLGCDPLSGTNIREVKKEMQKLEYGQTAELELLSQPPSVFATVKGRVTNISRSTTDDSESVAFTVQDSTGGIRFRQCWDASEYKINIEEGMCVIASGETWGSEPISVSELVIYGITYSDD